MTDSAHTVTAHRLRELVRAIREDDPTLPAVLEDASRWLARLDAPTSRLAPGEGEKDHRRTGPDGEYLPPRERAPQRSVTNRDPGDEQADAWPDIPPMTGWTTAVEQSIIAIEAGLKAHGQQGVKLHERLDALEARLEANGREQVESEEGLRDRLDGLEADLQMIRTEYNTHRASCRERLKELERKDVHRWDAILMLTERLNKLEANDAD